MSNPSDGITPEVIRQIMPPYHLSPDLLEATFAALPTPPPNASAASCQARIARLTQEISALMPADAAQARIAAQVLIVRELADTFITNANAPDLEVPQMCRLAHTAATLMQTAATLERSLKQHQRKPASFFSTRLAEDVDIAALDAAWRSDPHRQPQAAPQAAPEAAPLQTPPTQHHTPTEPQPDCQPHPLAPDATTPEWTRTLLDQGHRWSREVVRRRTNGSGGNGSSHGSDGNGSTSGTPAQ
jgi:hypothetical protein